MLIKLALQEDFGLGYNVILDVSIFFTGLASYPQRYRLCPSVVRLDSRQIKVRDVHSMGTKLVFWAGVKLNYTCHLIQRLSGSTRRTHLWEHRSQWEHHTKWVYILRERIRVQSLRLLSDGVAPRVAFDQAKSTRSWQHLYDRTWDIRRIATRDIWF